MSGNLTKLAAASAIATAGVIGFAGIASAHTATVSIDGGHCLPSGAYAGTLHITPTDLDKAPVATVSNAGSYQVTKFPYTLTVTVDTGSNVYKVHIDWNDGVKYDGSASLNFPAAGCGPVATVPPPTVAPIVTTVPVTTVPPVTEAPPVLTTTKVCESGLAPSVPVEDGSLVCPEFFPTTTTMVQVPAKVLQRTTTPKVVELPHTGAGTSTTRALIAGVLVLIGGLVLTVLSRRRAAE